MKIVHIITGLADGGAQAVLYRLCANDDQNQHVVISMMDEGKYGTLLQKVNVQVHSLNMSRGLIRIGDMVRLWLIVKKQHADLVQTWMYHADLVGGLASRLAGVRTVWGIHHSNLASGESKNSTIKVARFCAILSHVIPNRIICCSQRAGEMHKTLGYAENKIVIVPNGYDIEQFSPDPEARHRLRAEWKISDGEPLLGMVARFNPQKDHRTLISALGQLKRSGKSFRFVLIGAGMSRENTELIGWMSAEGISEQVYLYEQLADISQVMNALDVHVLSSAHGEAFPNVLCEAMACGTPCVTTDVGDAALIVGDTGWVVPPGASERLAQVLLTALETLQDTESWRARQTAARQRITDHFSVEKMVKSYRAVWAQAHNRSGTPSISERSTYS